MDIIHRNFEPLLDEYCWGLHYDPQLNLILHFGEPALEVNEFSGRVKEPSPYDKQRAVQARGRWRLWVYRARWDILSHRNRFASSASPAARRRRALGFLDGQKLAALDADPSTGWTRFDFDLGGSLHVGPDEEERDGETWLLYKPSGYVLSLRGDGTYDHVPASETDRRRRVRRRKLPRRRKEGDG